ncbi:hypothetical protein DID77_02650 [Candidatus Marinamargulisbacteria bacterium SCGC AG-439-L15]|nr:hypothetical protein DID77_02650 [Candidatus Marinamargulisbacteria bacterium SCGC AG-439-L15]
MTVEEAELSLEVAIDQLSKQKDEFITDRAILAKKEFDQLSKKKTSYSDVSVGEKEIIDIKGFKEHVQVLASIFKASQFDEFMLAIANPKRLYVIQFFIGVLRGMGVVVGAVLMASLAYVLLYEGALMQWISQYFSFK